MKTYSHCTHMSTMSKYTHPLMIYSVDARLTENLDTKDTFM